MAVTSATHASVSALRKPTWFAVVQGRSSGGGPVVAPSCDAVVACLRSKGSLTSSMFVELHKQNVSSVFYISTRHNSRNSSMPIALSFTMNVLEVGHATFEEQSCREVLSM